MLRRLRRLAGTREEVRVAVALNSGFGNNGNQQPPRNSKIIGRRHQRFRIRHIQRARFNACDFHRRLSKYIAGSELAACLSCSTLIYRRQSERRRGFPKSLALCSAAQRATSSLPPLEDRGYPPDSEICCRS